MSGEMVSLFGSPRRRVYRTAQIGAVLHYCLSLENCSAPSYSVNSEWPSTNNSEKNKLVFVLDYHAATRSSPSETSSNNVSNIETINFVNFTKALDSIHCDSLWRVLRLYGVPEPFVDIFKIFIFGRHAALRMNRAEQIFSTSRWVSDKHVFCPPCCFS